MALKKIFLCAALFFITGSLLHAEFEPSCGLDDDLIMKPDFEKKFEDCIASVCDLASKKMMEILTILNTSAWAR